MKKHYRREEKERGEKGGERMGRRRGVPYKIWEHFVSYTHRFSPNSPIKLV